MTTLTKGRRGAPGADRRDDGPARKAGPTEAVRELAATLKLATSPMRQRILDLLSEHERNVGQLCDALGRPSQPGVSHQLALLRQGRLVECERIGRTLVYRLTETGRAVMRAFTRLPAS
jgi:DNA-binding transcriptional ArsR family regulator